MSPLHVKLLTACIAFSAAAHTTFEFIVVKHSFCHPHPLITAFVKTVQYYIVTGSYIQCWNMPHKLFKSDWKIRDLVQNKCHPFFICMDSHAFDEFSITPFLMFSFDKCSFEYLKVTLCFHRTSSFIMHTRSKTFWLLMIWLLLSRAVPWCGNQTTANLYRTAGRFTVVCLYYKIA